MRRPPALALAPLLVLTALAGCLAPGAPAPQEVQPQALEPLTDATLGFGPWHTLRVPSFDGVEIHVDLRLPEGEGPFPVLVEFTPYSFLGDDLWALAGDAGLPEEGRPFLVRNGLAEFYVPRGYAVAVAHVRGTGESGGCLTIGGPEEGQDGVAVVEALAAQPWSSGKVALMGTSYVGTTPLQTAVLAPPHLTTIVPVSSVTEWYRYYFENGEQRVNGDPPPGSSYPDPLLWFALGLAPGLRTLATGGLDDARCPAEYTAEYWLQDDYTPFWQARNIRANLPNITAPVLYAHGLRDENTATNMLTDFWDRIPSEKRMWLQQHGHGVPAAKKEYHEYVHRWLDHFMLGQRNGALLLPQVVVEDNLGNWRAEATWPPRDAAARTFWLSPEGLADAAPAEGSAAYRDLGPDEEPALEGANHLRFASAPLAGPLHLAGEVAVHLVASSDATDTQFAVHLYDRAADGAEAFVTRGYLDARHRETLERGEDLAPGERYVFRWVLHPRDHVLEEGHSLVVVVKSSDPYVIPDATRARNEVFFGPEGSFLTVPAIDAALRTSAEAPPNPWGPGAR